MNWTSHTVKSNGITLHYLRGGKTGASPIVMLHGITDNAMCWDRVARVFVDDYDVILLDARGHGQSDKPESGYSYLDHAADVAGVIDAFALAPPVVFGHSMGAGTATVLAYKYPDHVRALVLEDPAWIEEPTQPDPEREQHMERWKAWIAGCKDVPLSELKAQQAEATPHWHESELQPWAESKHEVSVKVFEMTARSRLVWRDVVPSIQCPLLLVTAETERGAIISPEVADEVCQLPQAQVAHIAGAGHSIHRDQFEPYMAAVKAFLEQL